MRRDAETWQDLRQEGRWLTRQRRIILEVLRGVASHYLIASHRLEFYGVCPECRVRNKRAGGAAPGPSGRHRQR